MKGEKNYLADLINESTSYLISGFIWQRMRKFIWFGGGTEDEKKLTDLTALLREEKTARRQSEEQLKSIQEELADLKVTCSTQERVGNLGDHLNVSIIPFMITLVFVSFRVTSSACLGGKAIFVIFSLLLFYYISIHRKHVFLYAV